VATNGSGNLTTADVTADDIDTAGKPKAHPIRGNPVLWPLGRKFASDEAHDPQGHVPLGQKSSQVSVSAPAALL
jgi:hypothetical protein